MKNSTCLPKFLLLTFLSIISSVSYGYDLVVAQDGSGNHTTVQAAINAAPINSAVPFTIFIKNGKYREKVNIPSNKPFLQLTGESVAGVFIYYDDPATILGTQNSASFTINATDFAAVNITFANTFNYDSASAAGQTGLQAVAVLVNADRAAFKNCRFLGNQDTLYAKGSGTPRHYFKNCYIDGIVDFIFGSSVDVFDSCVIYAKARTTSGSSYITAANTPAGQNYGYVFRDCKFPANTGTTTYYLGRPWQNDGTSSPSAENKVTVLNSRLSDKIRVEGWSTWNGSTNTSIIQYNEYNSRYYNGTLFDVSQRVAWSNQLSGAQAATYTNANLFGSWDPCAVLAGFCNSGSPDIAVANFKGTKGVTTSIFNWNISWPVDQIKYELFRSTTTRNGVYSKLSEVIASNDTVINFSLTDANPPSGSLYYYYILASKAGLASNYSDTVQVSSAPTINVAANLSAFYQTLGSPSATQTYTVSGTDLQSNVTLTPPTGFEISNNGTNWYTNSTPLVLTQTGGILASTTITVRLNASSANTYSGNIVHTSTNATNYNLAVTGTAVVAPAINSVVLQQWPFTVNGNDDPAVRSAFVSASTPTFNRLTLSNGTTLAAIPAYSSTYGQAFGANANGDGTWTTAVGGPGGTLTRVHYEQFTVTANGRSIRLDSIIFNAAFYNTNSNTKMAIVYSKSGFTINDSTDVTGGVDQSNASVTGSFATPIALANQTGGPSNFYRIALNGSTGVTITSGQSLTIRLYFSCGSTGTPRYAMLKNVIVKGEAISPYPLSLISFNGSYNGSSVDLNWNTVNESGTQEFFVERSNNAKEFTSIAKVAAANQRENKYSAIDAKPFEGVNYYRLKIIDNNGSINYSKIILINTKPSKGITVYPNPVKESLTLTHAKAGSNAVVDIFSGDGKKMSSYKIDRLAIQSTLDVSELVKGIYLVVYSDNVNKSSSKFIKL